MAELAAGSTDDQNISGSGLSGTDLTIGIEGGTNETVDLSSLVGTDDQTATEVTYDNTTSGLTAADTQAAIDELAAGSTDDQNISGSVLSGTDLTIGIEGGTNETVDLSSLVGTDDQTATEVTYDNTTSGLTAADTQAAIDELAAGSTDDQNISGSGLSGTDLTIGIEGGTNETVDLSSLVGTDDQTATEVTYDNTTSGLTAADTQAAIDELAAGSTDDQNISGSGLSGTDLTIGIEGGTNETVDLSSLVGTDDQIANEVNITDAGGNFTATEVEGALAELAAGSTDDQNISGSGLSGTDLTIGIEGGTNETVDLSSLVGTDDQIANEVNITDAGGNFTSTEVEGALAELAAGSTDDQTASEVDSDSPIDVDGDGVTDDTVEDVIQAIAPITSKAARIFYPPSITVDASTTGIKSIDLYQEYLDQFGTPTAGSAGAPAAVPTYGRTELYYYVTYADPTVFETDSGDPNFITIDANGNLTIEVENTPADYNTLINVVFVVK